MQVVATDRWETVMCMCASACRHERNATHTDRHVDTRTQRLLCTYSQESGDRRRRVHVKRA
jgi:hypothetical protein